MWEKKIKKEPPDTGYEKNDEFQENVLLRKVCNSNKDEFSDEDIAKILINLEQSGNLIDSDITVQVNELHLQTDRSNEFLSQGLNHAN